MYYYYDILLNFGSEGVMYEFYEWESEDTIEFIKRIPLFRVNTNTLKDLMKYQVTFDKEILSLIENKTIVKSSSECLPYAFIISDAKNALALELNKEGLVISRSKLLLNDETNLLEMMFTIKETDFHYEKEKKYPKRNDLRQIEEIKKLIKCEMETLEHAKNESKLKYLYYEWFNKTCEDPKIILKEMKTALKKDYDASFLRIYDLIKLTYNKVN